MIFSVAVLALALADGGSTGVAVETLEAGRYRLSTVVRDAGSPTLHAEAQIRLMREGQRLCRGIGRAVSDGVIEVNRPPAGGGRRTRLVISETYSCVSP